MSLNSPRPRLPKLNALRAFEAAARHQSFTEAAEELGVTAGAVAQQIKSLEAWLGRSLFHRRSQGVSLTKGAMAALPDLVKAFDDLGRAVRSLKDQTEKNTIRIAALPAVAQLWLTPRLPYLYEVLPGVEISISALETPPNLNRELFDISLFFCDPQMQADGETICMDRLAPVCSPQLLVQSGDLNTPKDLAGFPLLHDAIWKNDWRNWLQAAKVTSIDPTQGATYSLYSMAVQAAIDGAGILIGHDPLIEEALADERLVRPFETPVLSGDALTLCLPPHNQKYDLLERLTEWFATQVS